MIFTDIQLHYTDNGNGFPLILLHGNGEDSSYFQAQTEYFSKKRRVIAVDTRGHGLSARGDKPFTLLQFAEDLKELFTSLNITKADILGFSDGGNIALIFALKYPRYVNSLVLNGANITPNGLKMYVRIPVFIDFCICSALSFSKSMKLRRERLLLMINQPHIPAGALSALDMPVLVITGTKDMIKRTHSKLITNSIKRAQYTEIEGSHFIAKENSAEFNRITDEFLSRNL